MIKYVTKEEIIIFEIDVCGEMAGNTAFVCHYEASRVVNWDHIKIFLDISELNAKCCIYSQNVVFIDERALLKRRDRWERIILWECEH